MIIKLGFLENKGMMAIEHDGYREEVTNEHEAYVNEICAAESWTLTIDESTITVKRPKVGKCPEVSYSFTSGNGTLYLKSKAKTAKAEFVPDDLSLLLWAKYGVSEICHSNPNRVYQPRFRECQGDAEHPYELVWTFTDGKVGQHYRQTVCHYKQVYKYGRLDCFEGNVHGFYLDKEIKRTYEIQTLPITIEEAVDSYLLHEKDSDHLLNELAVEDATFVVAYALSHETKRNLVRDLSILYTEEKDHRRILEMLDDAARGGLFDMPDEFFEPR